MRNWSPLPIRASSNSPRSHHSQSHTLRKHARIAASRTHRSIQLSKESRPAEINLTLEPNKKNLFGHKKTALPKGGSQGGVTLQEYVASMRHVSISKL